MKTRTALLAASAVLLAGCGGDDDTSSDRAASTTRSAPAVPQAEKDEALRLARSARLTLRDFPTGWSAKDDDDEDNEDDGDLECDILKGARSAGVARSSSPDFTPDGDDTPTVSQGVVVYRSAADARDWLRRLTGPETRKCLREAFDDEIEKNADDDVEIDDFESGSLRVVSAGDGVAATRFSSSAKAGGLNLDLIFDVVVGQQGRALSILLLFDTLSPVDGDLRDKLIGVAARRLEQRGA